MQYKENSRVQKISDVFVLNGSGTTKPWSHTYYIHIYMFERTCLGTGWREGWERLSKKNLVAIFGEKQVKMSNMAKILPFFLPTPKNLISRQFSSSSRLSHCYPHRRLAEPEIMSMSRNFFIIN